MKNYLPIAVGLILLGISPVHANDGMGVDVNTNAQADLSGAAAGAATSQAGASDSSATGLKTSEATQQDNSAVQPAAAQQSPDTDGKAAPVLENQPATGAAPGMAAPGTEATQTDAQTSATAGTDTKGTAAAPNVQKLFKFFHSQKQQAEGEPGKKDASTPATDAQSPQ